MWIILKCYRLKNLYRNFRKEKEKKLNFFVKEENVNMFDILFYIKDNLLKYLFDIYSILFVLI